MNQIFATRLHVHPTHWLIYAQAATRGDCAELRELIAEGAEVTTGDYDNRTALHLAAAEGHLDAVGFRVEIKFTAPSS